VLFTEREFSRKLSQRLHSRNQRRRRRERGAVVVVVKKRRKNRMRKRALQVKMNGGQGREREGMCVFVCANLLPLRMHF
jgi:L-2-hydroxyglutarate oxidase LhgO